jgi:DNA repair protein RadD
MLRPYQRQLVGDVRAAWSNGAQNVLMQLATGGGKTVCIADLIQSHSGASAAIAHRSQLVSQLSQALAREGVYHNLICSDADKKAIAQMHAEMFGRRFFEPGAPCAVVSVDTLNKRENLKLWEQSVTLWVTDEGHHTLRANKWGKAVARFTNPNVRGLLPTATPRRADGGGLGRHHDGVADVMVEGPPGRWLMDQGYLTRYRVIAADSHIRAHLGDVADSGDWSNAQLRKASIESEIVGDVVRTYLQHARGKLGITFATDVDTAGEIAAAYRAAGVPAEVLTGETHHTVRQAIWRQFEARELLQVVAVDVVSEGVDIPALEVVTFARPSASLAVVLQQLGRLLRPVYAPGYDTETAEGRFAAMAASVKGTHGLLIDHTGNFLQHGGGPDMPRTWSLDRREKRALGKPETPLRVCLNFDPLCGLSFPRYMVACPHCGHPIPPPARRDGPEHVDGDMTELDPALLDALRGAVDAVNLSPYEERLRLLAAKCPPAGIARNVERHEARYNAQLTLREVMALWGGARKAEGLTDREMQKKFYLQFGMTVLEAQALGLDDAVRLAEAMAANVPFDLADSFEWTESAIAKIASYYSSRKVFQDESSGAYDVARRLGVLDKACAHMAALRQSWTEESIAAEAIKYSTRGMFEAGNSSAYYAAFRLGVLDKVCAHMAALTKSWDEKSVAVEALKYVNRKSFRVGSSGAYVAARRFGVLDKICAHMTAVRQLWTEESIAAEAFKHSRLVDFRTHSVSAYNAARRLGILAKVCAHMKGIAGADGG